MKQLETRIQKLTREIDSYKEAIREAQNALAAAEQELDEELAYQAEAESLGFIGPPADPSEMDESDFRQEQ